MPSSQYFFRHLEQQQELQIARQRRQSEDEALRQTMESFFAETAANNDQEAEEAVVLFWALAYLGTPGLFRQMRTYLTRSDLSSYPMVHSAWAYMWKSRTDRAFITTMGIDVRTFDDLLERFSVRWDYSTIDRADVDRNGAPQTGRRSLDAAGTLGLVLHWVCSTMSCYTLQQVFAVTPAVCSQYLASGMKQLLAVLQEHPQARFLWPTTERKAREHAASIEKKYPLLTNCFGFLDGLNLPVLVSDDEE
jgi:hypothetical protein